MQISLDNAGKKFNKQWVFRNISHTFSESSHTAILGKNGSGKSTLLKTIASFISLTEGSVKYGTNRQAFCKHEFHSKLSIASPHLELIEELSLIQLLKLHFRLKPEIKNLSIEEAINGLELGKSSFKPVKHFSSGMKQRLKLGLALFSDVNLTLLDEPCTNLDKDSKKWYQDMLIKTAGSRTLIIFSNNNYEEIFSCSSSFSL